jgi:cyclophilin family peptidyl-prolyl cis-trans isomerase
MHARIVATGTAIGFLAASAAGCGGDSSAGGCTTVKKPVANQRGGEQPKKHLDPKKTYTLTFRTNCGSFAVKLDVKGAPETSASLVSLSLHRYFDHTIFHRIVPNFVIQGGDPTQSGSGGPGYQTVDKPRRGTKYSHGVMAMAKTQVEPPGTSGSQFFIVTGDDVKLPPDYAVVGKVTRGLDVVDRIGELGDVDTEQPTQTVEVQKVTVHVS